MKHVKNNKYVLTNLDLKNAENDQLNLSLIIYHKLEENIILTVDFYCAAIDSWISDDELKGGYNYKRVQKAANKLLETYMHQNRDFFNLGE